MLFGNGNHSVKTLWIQFLIPCLAVSRSKSMLESNIEIVCELYSWRSSNKHTANSASRGSYYNSPSNKCASNKCATNSCSSLRLHSLVPMLVQSLLEYALWKLQRVSGIKPTPKTSLLNDFKSSTGNKVWKNRSNFQQKNESLNFISGK